MARRRKCPVCHQLCGGCATCTKVIEKAAAFCMEYRDGLWGNADFKVEIEFKRDFTTALEPKIINIKRTD